MLSKKITTLFIYFGGIIAFALMLPTSGKCQQQKADESTKLTIRLRGVFDSNVSLSRYNGSRYSEPIKTLTGVTGLAEFSVSKKDLPGQFLIRMDYRKTKEDKPYPSELIFFLNRENIELGINPLSPVGDSIFYKNDNENRTYQAFIKENSDRRRQLALLGQLLEGYERKNSLFYSEAIEEFNTIQKNYNEWIDKKYIANKNLFVSSTFPLQKVISRNWNDPIKQQIEQQGLHYFDNIDFNDSLMIRTQAFNDFVNSYVNMYGMQITSNEMRDSLFTHAGLLACQKAAKGHPKVYGWMVDYFYRGYESYNITKGITMLQQFINDPKCLTTKKQEILKRLSGMEKMKTGSAVPEFEAEMYNGIKLHFDGVPKQKKYELLVFYESNCSHCNDLLKELKTWYSIPENKIWFDIITVAVDDSRASWESNYEKNKFEWNDVWASGGINSKVANDYYILSTPILFIIDKEMKILAIPQSVNELEKFLNQ